MATAYDCKFIETSVGINHNVDELLVGLLTQIRLKLENPEKSRFVFIQKLLIKFIFVIIIVILKFSKHNRYYVFLSVNLPFLFYVASHNDDKNQVNLHFVISCLLYIIPHFNLSLLFVLFSLCVR
jgi:hypothetical protein